MNNTSRRNQRGHKFREEMQHLSSLITRITGNAWEQTIIWKESRFATGISVALVTPHSKCCRDRQGALTQDSWDDAFSSSAISSLRSLSHWAIQHLTVQGANTHGEDYEFLQR